MRLSGSDTFGVPRERVWAFLMDPRQLGACVPGVGGIEVLDATHFAITTVGVGVARATVTVEVEPSSLRAAEHVVLLAKGRARGLAVEAAATLDLRDGRETGTTALNWSTEVEVTGPLAPVGVRMLEGSARSLIAQTFRCMSVRLGEGSSAGANGLALPGAEVMRFDPNWCLFWGAHVSSAQLDIWVPYIRRSRQRFAILAQDGIRPEDREKIDALPNAIVVEPYPQGLEWLRACRGFRGYLYVTTKRENFPVVNQHRNLAHVFIGHGDSGKGASGFRTGSLYDSIFVAEYAAVRRFPRAIRPWIWRGAIATGAPVVEGVRSDAWTHPRRVRSILYAPTWEGYGVEDYTSLDVVAPVLQRLLPALAERGIEVLVRPHPATGGRRPELKGLVEELRTAGMVPAVSKSEAFERADVLISDISGVTAEFLLTQKPSILPIVPQLAQRGRDGAWLDVEYPWVYHWDATADGLLALLDAIQARDPLRARRASAARKKFRHHRSIDDAVRTFDLALGALRWRNLPIPLRIPFEARLLRSRLRRRS